MSSGKILLGVLAGVAAGAMLGILFAPDNGWNTRKRIVKKSEDYADELMGKIGDFLFNFSENIDEVEDEIIDFSEHGRTRTTEA